MVSLSAGYQADGTPAEIWRGLVFQPMFEREGTDFKLSLRCIIGFLEKRFISTTVGPIATQWEIVQRMCQSALPKPIPIAHLDPPSAFNGRQMTRTSTIFGTPTRFLQQIAAQNGMVSYFDADGLHMGKLETPSTAPDITYGPPLAPGQQPHSDEANITRSLIETPQQTDFSVNFRVLLDPRPQTKLPPMLVKIDNTIIRQQPLQNLTNSSILTQDGVYIVAGVRHFGDSRGNEWYTEITGIAGPQNQLAFLAKGAPNAGN
ncbi:MAG: hypothetical protein ACR2JE_05820 [Acidobacteriaceae bacterium]